MGLFSNILAKLGFGDGKPSEAAVPQAPAAPAHLLD
jgi:hypothetical protein